MLQFDLMRRYQRHGILYKYMPTAKSRTKKFSIQVKLQSSTTRENNYFAINNGRSRYRSLAKGRTKIGKITSDF